MRGKSLEKYGVRTVKTYYIDQFAVAELMMGAH